MKSEESIKSYLVSREASLIDSEKDLERTLKQKNPDKYYIDVYTERITELKAEIKILKWVLNDF